MEKIKDYRGVTFLLAFVIGFNLLSFNVYSIESGNDNVLQIPDSVQYEIDVNGYGDFVSRKPLYNSQDEITAFCLDFDGAYLIYNINGCVMEHSPQTNSPYYNTNEKAYYCGPLVYCVKNNDDEFIEINTNEVVSENSFIETSRMDYNAPSYSNALNINSTYSTGYNVETYYTDFAPYCLNCNDDGTCGVVAATIFFMYYHKNIYSGFANPYFMNSPVSFHNYLLNNYLAESGDFNSLVRGMNKYISSKNINNLAFAVNQGFQSFLGFKIRNKEPVILGLYGNDEVGESWRINHWVLAYGYREYFMNNQSYNIEYIVNDGWGHNQVFITYDTSYMDGVIGLSLNYNS